MYFSGLSHKLPSGETVPLPPVILAEFERDPKKASLCIYGHVDVQPAKMADGWTTDPFNLTEIKGIAACYMPWMERFDVCPK